MNSKRIFLFWLLVTIFVSSCKESQEARRPVSQVSGTFMRKSAERNKKLNATEEEQIDLVMKSNPKIKYLASTQGFWYTYNVQNKQDTVTPKKGDVALFSYEIKDLNGKLIYSEQELKQQTYAIDKQNIMTGLREGIKLMHKKEKVTFLFPSHIAYGYHGDDKKIGTNKPIICIVTLQDFDHESAFNQEVLPNNPNLSKQASTKVVKKPTNYIKKIKDSLTN